MNKEWKQCLVCGKNHLIRNKTQHLVCGWGQVEEEEEEERESISNIITSNSNNKLELSLKIIKFPFNGT